MDHATMVKEAESIAAIARANADQTEAGHRLAPAVAEAIVGSPLARAWRPSGIGGEPGHPADLTKAIETIATADASAAWCAGIAFGVIALAAVLQEDAAKEFFADRHIGLGTFSPTGRLVEADDGYGLNGRWPFASNCQQAGWGAIGFMRYKDGAPIMGPSGPVTGIAFVDREQFAIDANWDMAGLRGTGSHDITADTRVPESLVSDIFAPKWADDPIFRLRMFDLLGPSLGVVPAGIGEAALAATRAHIAATGDLPQRGPKPPFGVDVMSQAAFGRVESRLRMAKAFLYDSLDDSYQHALRGDVPPRAASARITLALFECLDAGTDAVNFAVQVIGTAAAREGAPVDRMRRDMQALSCHVLFAPANRAPMGRQAAGMDTVHWPFLPPDPE